MANQTTLSDLVNIARGTDEEKKGNSVFFVWHFSKRNSSSTISNFQNQYYWTSSGPAEVDCVIQHDGDILPLEVKSNISVRSKSLKIYDEKYHPKLNIRLSMLNLKRDGDILNIPLYLVDELHRLLTIS